MKRLLVCFLIILCGSLVFCKEDCIVPECLFKIRGLPPMNIIERFGKPVPVFGKAMLLKSPKGYNECKANLGKFLSLYIDKFDGRDLVAVFGFRCRNYDLVHFSNFPENGSRPENAMSFLQVEGCRISLQDYNKLANHTNTEHVLFRAHVITDEQTFCSENDNTYDDVVASLNNTNGELKASENATISEMKNSENNTVSELKTSDNNTNSESKASENGTISEIKNSENTTVSDLKTSENSTNSEFKTSENAKVNEMKNTENTTNNELKDQGNTIITELKATENTIGNKTKNPENTTDSQLKTSDSELKVQCNLFDSALDVWVENPPNNNDTSLSFITQCDGSFPLMREAIFSGMRWEEMPKEIMYKFPNLQTLEITNNYLTLPPKEFPWNDSLLFSPRNISRTSSMAEQYSKVYNIEIEANLTRRVYRLDNNRITDLTEFQFHGYLHMISLKNNNVSYIGQNTFSNVKGLQHISLDQNNLTVLPTYLFRGLKHLRHLSLQDNALYKLKPETFEDLTQLVYLNLANNSLGHLKNGIFVNLVKLKEIHLEHNKLTSVSSNVFPISTISLHSVFLHNNPLEIFPEFLFYVRNLRQANLRNGNISFQNFSDIIVRVINPYLIESIARTTSSEMDFKKVPEHMRKIDLSANKIKKIGIDSGILSIKKYWQRLEIILKHFHFLLDDNPLRCDCDIIPFSNVINQFVQNGSFSGKEYFFNEWKCQWPEELVNRPMLKAKEEETYCEKNITFCPENCTCYERSISKILIVDCRDRNFMELPDILPNGKLELWLQRNNISSLTYRGYLKQVTRMYMSENVLEHIDHKAVEELRNVQILRLDSNMLASLPPAIRSIKSKEIYLKGNPFKCDCNTLWMKSWIMEKVGVIRDVASIACNIDDGKGKQFVSVPDEEFICVEGFDSIKHMVTPAIACSLSIAIFLAIFCFTYIFRLEVKVLLYIYFGIHPFDKDENSGDEQIDVVIVHSPTITEWVHENIVSFLEQDGRQYVVCEMMRDFIAGFSYQENITSTVRHSKRMLIILSKDMMDDNDLIKVAWNEAQEKIKEHRTNYVIFMTHHVQSKQIQNKDLKRYFKRGRCIDTQDSLFKEKILYSMPDLKGSKDDSERDLPDLRETIQDMYGPFDDEDIAENNTLFIAYSDKELNYTLKELKPTLENLGHNLYLPDRDFIPGASKEENILKAVDSCIHTLFLISGENLQDEWSLFTFRCAIEKSLRQKCNHLIVLIADDIRFEDMDEEVKYYMKTHVTLDIRSTWYWKRVINSLPSLAPTKNHEKRLDEVDTDIDPHVLYLNKRNLKQNEIIPKTKTEHINKEIHADDCTCEKCALENKNTGYKGDTIELKIIDGDTAV